MKLLVTLLGLFGAPRSDSAPGNCAPLAPHSLRPCLWGSDNAAQKTVELQLKRDCSQNMLVSLFFFNKKQIKSCHTTCSRFRRACT